MPEDSLEEVVLYSHPLGPRAQTQMLNLGSKQPCVMSHLTGPVLCCREHFSIFSRIPLYSVLAMALKNVPEMLMASWDEGGIAVECTLT